MSPEELARRKAEHKAKKAAAADATAGAEVAAAEAAAEDGAAGGKTGEVRDSVVRVYGSPPWFFPPPFFRTFFLTCLRYSLSFALGRRA